jgi:RND family efflux transporter MFP subunit
MVSIGIVMGFLLGPRNGKERAKAMSEHPPYDVSVEMVTVHDKSSVITVAGSVEPIRRATPSARIMAKVLTAGFHDGQRVCANQVLVRLDTRDWAARQRQAVANQGAADTALEVAEANLRRMKSLVEAGAAPQTQLEAVQVAAAQARAATKTVGAALDEIDVNVSYAVVASPFDGVVVQKMTEAGNIVGPGQPLFIVEDDSRLRVIAPIGAEDARGLTQNQALRVMVGGTPCQGVVEGIMPSGDSRAPGLRLQLLVDNPDRHMKPGSIAIIEIPGRGPVTPILSIPSRSVIARGSLTGAYVVGEDKIAKLRWLVLGENKNDHIEVLSGLREKDQVVLNPGPDLVDGQVVRERPQ